MTGFKTHTRERLMKYSQRNRLTTIHTKFFLIKEITGHTSKFLPPLLLSIIAITMSEAAVTVRVRKFMRNPLLKRRQMVLL